MSRDAGSLIENAVFLAKSGENKYRVYEEFKGEISGLGLPAPKYEDAVRRLAEELRA